MRFNLPHAVWGFMMTASDVRQKSFYCEGCWIVDKRHVRGADVWMHSFREHLSFF